MKCEIINGRLHVKAGTVTEQWALDQFFGSMATYQNPHSYIVDAKHAQAPEVQAALKAEDDAELDAIFGPNA